MAMKAFYNRLDKEAAKFTPIDTSFSLWTDRQRWRPTMGATLCMHESIHDESYLRRRDVEDELFVIMIQSQQTIRLG